MLDRAKNRFFSSDEQIYLAVAFLFFYFIFCSQTNPETGFITFLFLYSFDITYTELKTDFLYSSIFSPRCLRFLLQGLDTEEVKLILNL